VPKVLVVGPSWIGDTVLAQPLFRLIHETRRDVILDVLAPQSTLPLLGRMPEVRRTIVNPFAHGQLKLRERRRLGRELRAERYDQAIVLSNTFKSALVPYFAGIPQRTGFRGEMRYGVLNDLRLLDTRAMPRLVKRYAALAMPAGSTPPPIPDISLRIDEDRRRATLVRLAVDVSRPVAALCPGAEYGPAKRWPTAYFAELAKRFVARGFSVWIVGSGKEQGIGEEIVRLSGGACVNLCGATTLDEAIDVLASCVIVVSNDSGLMHVAAALGRRVVALYGSSTPSYTPPLSHSAAILWLGLSCSPCFRRECPLGHFNCMMQLTPDRVCSAIDFDKIALEMR
jgi:heptosyltransferase-2